MLRVAVCDDDERFLARFVNSVRDVFEKQGIISEVLGISDPSMLLEVHRSEPFDTVFLDIDMPSVNGFKAAKAITEISPQCCIVFVTSHNELVYDSFEFRPLNFIVKQEKSVMLPKLDRVIGQLSDALTENEKIILENSERGRFSVSLADVVYIESSDHDVLYHIKGEPEPFRVRAKLSGLEAGLSEKNFVRVHKKYLVSLRYVFNIDLTRECVILKTGSELPMGRSFKPEVDRCLTEYLKRAR